MNTQIATRYMQGIAVPETSVNPQEFFARTRRRRQLEASKAFAGLGNQDTFEMKKVDILAGILIKLTGTVTSTPGAGTVATTARWPYDLIKNVRFTANGQANIINVSGSKLKAREVMKHSDLTDRGIVQSVSDANVQSGTLALASERWGVGNRDTAIAGGNYDYDLAWYLPIAEDDQDLMGAIFAATSSTDLTVQIDWATSAELFVLTGNATAAVSGTVELEALRFSIPIGPDGQIVIPDLTTFHSLIQTRHTGLGNGVNELRLMGQGAGKTLLRTYAQLWNGAAGANNPVEVNSTNFGTLAWRFGGNETPDSVPNGRMLRMLNERDYNSDIGAAVHGFWCHEFASENAFRDSVDLGTTSEFRHVLDILPAVVLNNAALEVVTETIYTAGAGA
ncbi:hypothetical protein [Nocardioides sp.]|uniref:hypothetical protein n=1 Tax=Nocardioides sp. TaxID=35761 RepID=UPI002C0BBD01|nr:hypothetical protein [Nocardioides sp.]HSX68122.1 hypothetical protein [Nocardioides sp.]